MSQRSRASWSSWLLKRAERRLARTLDHLELLEQRAVQQEVQVRLRSLTPQERLELLLAGPPTPAPQPRPPEPLSREETLEELTSLPLALPVLHRPEALEEPPPPPAEEQVLGLLSQSTPSSPSSVG
jgi:hypothetical protein